MKILVTGATGNLGSLVVESLLKSVPAENLAVSVRDPKKAEHLKALGVDVRFGDFHQPVSLVSAFAGIDRLLIISSGDFQNRAQQQLAAVNAAKEANVSFIAYTSAANAKDSEFFITMDHRATEEAILQSGIPYSFLRNNWYLENELSTIQAVLNGAPWVTSAGSGKVGWVGHRDFAEAAANVLAGEGHNNTVYELSGKPLTQEELASILAGVIGREVPVQQVNDETYGKIMSNAGVPAEVIPLLVAIQSGIRAGYLDVESNDFEKLLGRPITTLGDVIRQLIG